MREIELSAITSGNYAPIEAYSISLVGERDEAYLVIHHQPVRSESIVFTTDDVITLPDEDTADAPDGDNSSTVPKTYVAQVFDCKVVDTNVVLNLFADPASSSVVEPAVETATTTTTGKDNTGDEPIPAPIPLIQISRIQFSSFAKRFEGPVRFSIALPSGELKSTEQTDVSISGSEQVYYGSRGVSAFGKALNFRMERFSKPRASKVVSAMQLVSHALVTFLGKFESSMPDYRRARDRVWNIRKSQNTRPLTVRRTPEACGTAQIGSGDSTHSILFTLSGSMVDGSTHLGIASTMIHEIAHQFGVRHTGWLNTGDFEAGMWAAHRETNPSRAHNGTYYHKINLEIRNCAKLRLASVSLADVGLWKRADADTKPTCGCDDNTGNDKTHASATGGGAAAAPVATAFGIANAGSH